MIIPFSLCQVGKKTSFKKDQSLQRKSSYCMHEAHLKCEEHLPISNAFEWHLKASNLLELTPYATLCLQVAYKNLLPTLYMQNHRAKWCSTSRITVTRGKAETYRVKLWAQTQIPKNLDEVKKSYCHSRAGGTTHLFVMLKLWVWLTLVANDFFYFHCLLL